MNKTLFFICIIGALCGGCASYGINHAHGTINGPFNYDGATVLANVEIDHWGCVGMGCQQVNMEQVINAINNGSTSNTAKQ